MAFRPKPSLRDFATLEEAMHWIAYDNFEGVLPDTIDPEGFYFVTETSFRVRKSQEELLSALREGEIIARGRFSEAADKQHDDWRQKVYKEHLWSRTEIPPQWWMECEVNWCENSAMFSTGESRDVVVPVESVLRIWPSQDNQEHLTVLKQGGRGRKEEYPRDEFFLLCAWEAHANSLPEKQAELIRRMEGLLSIMWGEENTPGQTWLKARVRELYSVRDRHEQGRQQSVGK
jgi:hypothetical protein